MTPTEIIVLNIVCTLIGFLIGNRLAIDRDRRKEFKALVEPAHDLVFRRGMPDELTISKIHERLCFLRRRGFYKAVIAYEKSQGEENRNAYNPEIGGFDNGCGPYKDPGLIDRAADRLHEIFEAEINSSAPSLDFPSTKVLNVL